MTETIANKNRPKMPTQKRALERFEYILDFADKEWLEGRQNELTIYELAKMADLPAQSVYRMFPSLGAVNFALAQRYLNKVAEMHEEADNSSFTSWQQALEQGFIASSKFYQQYPHAMELILGSSVSREIRAADRENTTQLATSAVQRFKDSNLVGNLEVFQFEIVINIVDAIWSQSYHNHNDITPLYLTESIRAATSYLELYLPRYASEY